MVLSAAKFEMLPHIEAIKGVYAKYWRSIKENDRFGLLAQMFLEFLAPAFPEEKMIPRKLEEMVLVYREILENGGHLVKRMASS